MPNSRCSEFRAAIAAFIDARRDAKLNGKEGDEEASAKYDHATWLADAARRASQIQAVTHVLKATHPDARGTNLHVAPSTLPQHTEIGSHLLGGNDVDDVVGNAAALDVFKLLKLEVEGHRLLDWMRAGDADLQAALSDSAEEAQSWMRSFASLVRESTRPASHPLAKQLYWMVGDAPQDDTQYHLLQPLFASSLAHAVHADIQDARFGETNKALRDAWHEGKPGEGCYRDYRGLIVRKLGGSKPQNISQLNSERGGVNYLLASLPPRKWKPPTGTNLLKSESVFSDRRGVYFRYGAVRELVRDFGDFLAANPEPNAPTRRRTKAFVRDIADQLALFGADVGERYGPGWTRAPDCELVPCERLWLDPQRSELPERDDPEHPEWQEDDRAFNAAYAQGDWADEVAARFGRWLNGQLREQSKKLVTLGEVEMRHFARQVILDVAWPIPQQRRAMGATA